MSDTSVSYRYLSDAENIAAYSFLFISSILSLFGSANIVYLVSQRKNIWGDKSQIYHRLVLGLSLMDIIMTLAIFLAPFVNRKDTDLYFAKGNVTTCEWGAFFFQFTIGSAFYSCMLSIYFLRTIRYGKKPENAFFQERWLHVLGFSIPLAFGIAGILTDVFNPSVILGLCEYSAYPWNCVYSDGVECERGAALDIVNGPHSALYVLFSITGIVCTWLVYWTIRRQGRRNQRWSRDAPGSDSVQRKRTRAVGMQAIWYTLVFLITGVSAVTLEVIKAIYLPEAEEASDLAGEGFIFAAALLTCMVFPIQGFLNFLIYIRPRLIRWKDSNPDKSWIWAYTRILSGEKAPTTVRTSHFATKSLHISNRKGTDTLQTLAGSELQSQVQFDTVVNQPDDTVANSKANIQNSSGQTEGSGESTTADGDKEATIGVSP